jgi:hypothetical protein
LNSINIKGCFYYLIKTFQNWREWSKPSLNVRPDDLIEIETTLILLMEFVAWNCSSPEVTKKENGGSGGARTRNLCRDRAAL